MCCPLDLRLDMASPDSKPTNESGSTQSNPAMPNGKASAAAPKVTDDNDHENVNASGSTMSPDEDIMQLARLGDVQAVEKLFTSGKYDATYCDAEGITPLHACVHRCRPGSVMLTDM